MEGFSQKLHLIVDELTNCLKSLADNVTEKQFDVFVQQQLKSYGNIFLVPKELSKELRLNIIQSHHQPLNEKNKRLRSITFTDFQQFCRNFCKQVKIKALVQGNVTEERALNVVHNLLNELDCGRVQDVSNYFPGLLFLTALIDVPLDFFNRIANGQIAYRCQLSTLQKFPSCRYKHMHH